MSCDWRLTSSTSHWSDMTSLPVAAENDVTSGEHAHGSSSSEATVSRQRSMPITHYNTFNGPFFSTIRSPRRQCFVIHPEWASEKIALAKWITSAAQQQQQAASATWTAPRTGRRCHSAPPGTRSRNPITWENWWVWTATQRNAIPNCVRPRPFYILCILTKLVYVVRLWHFAWT